MSEEVKKHLDSANFKFKDVDENGVETELTLSEMIEKLVNDNGMLANIIKNKQERIDKVVKWLDNANVIVFEEINEGRNFEGKLATNRRYIKDILIKILKGDE